MCITYFTLFLLNNLYVNINLWSLINYKFNLHLFFLLVISFYKSQCYFNFREHVYWYILDR